MTKATMVMYKTGENIAENIHMNARKAINTKYLTENIRVVQVFEGNFLLH